MSVSAINDIIKAMNIDAQRRKQKPYGLLFVVALLIGFTSYIYIGLKESARIYDATQKELSRDIYSGRVGTTEFTGIEGLLNIPTWEVFQSGNIWTLVSADNPLPDTYTPADLIRLELTHGDNNETMQVQSRLIAPLTKLYSDAEAAGYPLMISSAYRSIADQEALYEEFVSTQGQAAAKRYVADPGSSEHHTGLAVDFSNASNACITDSDKCSLGLDTSSWLARNAHKYGFINRYPEGKQPITGIAYEPWHYRYVGIPLATRIYESDLTLDEALTQMRPAFSK